MIEAYKGKAKCGMKFHNITLVGFHKRDSSSRPYWICKCSCGKIKSMGVRNILTNKVKSCGYCNTWGEMKGNHWSTVLYNAKIRNIKVEISSKEAWELFLKQERKCSYTGELLYFDTDTKNGTASLDRIDNDKGYTINNIQWVHKDINRMKNTFNDKQFLNFCKTVVEYRQL